MSGLLPDETRYINVVLDVPLAQTFSYAVPAHLPMPSIGTRVSVRFRHKHVAALVWETDISPTIDAAKVLAIHKILDEKPLLTAAMRQLAERIAAYYHHPIGQTVFTFLPSKLRKPQMVSRSVQQHYRVAAEPYQAFLESGKAIKSQKQARLLDWLVERTLPDAEPLQWVSRDYILDHFPATGASINALCKKGLCQQQEISQGGLRARRDAEKSLLILNDEQQAALEGILESRGRFAPIVLDGITGSGKTEVYLRAIEQVLAKRQRVLLLVPEIGLMPQMTARFLSRLDATIGVLHSGRNDTLRADTWLAAQAGEIDLLIGTRSAMFAPLENLGLIIVDEEHDPAYKQQDGIRYHARDMAIWLAQLHDCPIVLGSATPSLETLANVQRARFQSLRLTQRAGGAQPPSIQIIDMRGLDEQQSFSDALLSEMQQTLSAGHQVLLFLNRRGYAPTLYCGECGWIKDCPNCSANMVVHQRAGQVRCHHCGYFEPQPTHCEQCHSDKLSLLGHGTQRIEAQLEAYVERLGHFPIIRIDRDTTTKVGALATQLAEIQTGEPAVLVGTQMLAKGHHFPHVALVGVLNIDHGFYASDFRAIERMGQMILQVAGRAGRDKIAGRMLLQTRQPDAPALLTLLREGYHAFSQQILAEREQMGLPPYQYHALINIEAPDLQLAEQSAQRCAALWQQSVQSSAVLCLGPIPAPMTRRAGMHRFELLLSSDERASMRIAIDQWLRALSAEPLHHSTFWSIDVDPIGHY